jgi:starch synthase (maltosyl-transferring)
VGDETGGHTAVHPELGTLDDFRRLLQAAKKSGFEIALDFTSNCSPDHPWVREHPDWFFYNPDGTIQYAENPPKKYQDVYPLNFCPPDRQAMWEAIKEIFLFWAANGVETFRVDNPHTKPDDFWEWLIREVKAIYPRTIFLAEAFTDYDHLEELARRGFSQSYSYFTWRTGKNELIEYFLKLTDSYLKEFLRVNCFVNTPDILSEILQKGGKPAFLLRIALAATICPLYGMYSGYELLENEPLVAGKESYLDSEKYQIKVRDWNKPGNIKSYIARLNRIRQENPALQYYDNLRFYNSTDDSILFYGKVSPDGTNRVLVAINLDPFATHTSRITVPVERLGISSDAQYPLRELIRGRRLTWRGREQYVTLDPKKNPAAIWRI